MRGMRQYGMHMAARMRTRTRKQPAHTSARNKHKKI